MLRCLYVHRVRGFEGGGSGEPDVGRQHGLHEVAVEPRQGVPAVSAGTEAKRTSEDTDPRRPLSRRGACP
jgi:hypothetical protein